MYRPILTSCNYVTIVRATHIDFTDHAFVCAEIDLPVTGPATATLLHPERKLSARSYNSFSQALDGQNFEKSEMMMLLRGKNGTEQFHPLKILLR